MEEREEGRYTVLWAWKLQEERYEGWMEGRTAASRLTDEYSLKRLSDLR